MLDCWIAGLLDCWIAGLLDCWVGLVGWLAGWLASITDRCDTCRLTDVHPILSSASVWSPIPYPEEIGREE
ncbi:hypothetical protein, partial [Xanthomonas hortorum]|uniref:hypothetical protein n=1 Tax=Xanthomonas hortorum TaxID=56454 RepID=UPI0032E925D1